MQLEILRTESKGMSGGLSFEYAITLTPNQHESGLIQKYKIEREVIYHMERSLLGQKWEVSFTLGDFLKGRTIKNKNIVELIALENAVVTFCDGLKIVLNAMSKIGQKEIITL